MILNQSESDPVFYATSVLFILHNQKVTVVHVYMHTHTRRCSHKVFSLKRVK